MRDDLPRIRDGSILLSKGDEPEFNHLSIYICGPPQSGKSALCRSLISSCTASADSIDFTTLSRGINIKTIRPSENAAIKFWDFGNQSEYFINQDIFTAANLHMFLVLIDCRSAKSEWLEKTRYWLQYIVTQSSSTVKPRVMVIASHTDEINQVDEEGYSLEASLGIISFTLFPEFVEVLQFVTDSIITVDARDATSEGVKSIYKHFTDLISDTERRNTQCVPWICTEILRVLEKSERLLETRCMAWTEYCDLMKVVTDNISVLSSATRRLHELGEVYFDPTKLIGVVIIDLNWFYNDVLGWLYAPARQLPMLEQAGIVMFRMLAENGPVKSSDIPNSQIFPNVSIDMLGVLEACEICYGFDQAGVKMYVFPCMLRAQPIRAPWLKQDIFMVHLGLKFVCSKPTMIIPPGFFHRLQVRLRIEIGPRFSGTASQTDSIWRFGTICKLDNAIALIRLASNRQSILVHVRGDSYSSKEVRTLMQRIVKVVQYKLNLCKGLSLNVEHCVCADLQANEPEPQTLTQSAVLAARERGAKCVFSLDGTVESISKLLAFDSEGNYAI